MHLQALGSTKTRQISHIIPGILPICINTHGQYTTPTCPNVHTKYCKYFHGFLNSRLMSFPRNPRKLMYREYYHVYSIWLQSQKSRIQHVRSASSVPREVTGNCVGLHSKQKPVFQWCGCQYERVYRIMIEMLHVYFI